VRKENHDQETYIWQLLGVDRLRVMGVDFLQHEETRTVPQSDRAAARDA
jgi:hypothetical protein